MIAIMIAEMMHQGGGICIDGGTVNIGNSQISSNFADRVSTFSNLPYLLPWPPWMIAIMIALMIA